MLQKPGVGCGCFNQLVSADSLQEAEQAAMELASEHFEGKSVVLVHIGALVYNVYIVEEPIAQVQISTI
jgi:hypothetical protein